MKQKVRYRALYQLIAKSMLVLLFSFVFFNSYSQERVVTGVVLDESNTPIPGASVIIKGTTTGGLSDIDGKFSLKVPGSESIIVISYVGYETQEISAGQQTSINITLKEKATELDQIVVVGYGVQKKKLVTGATVQVSDKDIDKNHVTRIESALQGITPGMVIVKQNGQPGSDYNINIRGLGSPNGNTPLVLIDGVPGSLNTLNPEDIERVDVLKDAASAAIYGSRGGAGVILVTMKKGKSGEAVVSFDSYFGVSNLAKKVDLLNAKQYATILNEAQLNQFPKTTPDKMHFSQKTIDTLGAGTDWLGIVTNKNAPSRNYHLGINGGNDKTSYNMSLSYTSEEGILDYENKSDYERLGLVLNTNHKVKSYLKIGENVSYTHRSSKALGNGNMYGNFLFNILSANPIIPLHGPTPYYNGFGVSTLDSNQTNPVAGLHYNNNAITNNDDIIGDVYAEIQITKGLKFRSDFGGTLGFKTTQDHTDTFQISGSAYQTIPDFKQSMERNFFYNFDNVLTWEKDFGKHNVVLMVGTNAQDNWFFKVDDEVQGFQSNVAPVLTNVTTLDTVIKVNGDYGKGDSRYSYFGRLDYNYDQKYMATGTLRRDVSSRFGPNNRVGYFPSVSAGWAISKESFMEPMNSWLDFFKLRASWGKNGTEPTIPYRYLATVASSSRYYTFGGTKQTGTSPDKMANPNLKWEAQTQTDIGFDSKFLKNFSFSFDWYNKTATDWIVPKPVAGIFGIEGISTTNPFVNGGDVINKGVEFELDYAKRFGDFDLDVKASFAYNKNKVTNVPDSLIRGSISVLYNGSEELYRVQEGYPLGYFWGYKTNGIFQDTAQINHYTYTNPATGKTKLIQPGAKPGDVIFQDLNHDGKIDQLDKTQIGDPNPHYVYGLNIGTSYKGFDFSVNLQGVAGNSIVQSYRSLDAQLSNYTTEILGRWTGPGTSNRIPRVTENGEANKNWRNFSDLSVQDGSYLRVKSVSLGYDLKRSILKNTPVQQFRIYISAINLLTFTKYNGFDPEIGYGSSYDSNGNLVDAYASGIDLGNYPSARTYMIGINLKF